MTSLDTNKSNSNMKLAFITVIVVKKMILSSTLYNNLKQYLINYERKL